MSGFFEWDPAKFGLGVAEMDREHEALIGLMNRLHVLREARAPRADLGAALDALSQYTVQHFRDEEAYMARIGHAGLARHRLMHETLLGRLGVHAEQFRKTGALGNDFFYFLTTWLRAHIRGVDAEYAGKPAVA